MIYLLLAFVISLLASVALCASVRRIAPSVGAVVPPRADRWHSEPTPTMGGVAIAIAATLGFGAVVSHVNGGVLPAPSPQVPVPDTHVAVQEPDKAAAHSDAQKAVAPKTWRGGGSIG